MKSISLVAVNEHNQQKLQKDDGFDDEKDGENLNGTTTHSVAPYEKYNAHIDGAKEINNGTDDVDHDNDENDDHYNDSLKTAVNIISETNQNIDDEN